MPKHGEEIYKPTVRPDSPDYIKKDNAVKFLHQTARSNMVIITSINIYKNEPNIIRIGRHQMRQYCHRRPKPKRNMVATHPKN